MTGSKATKMNNRNSFLYYKTRLLSIALSMFEWKNLPIEIDPVYMEMALIETGSVLFFKDEFAQKYAALKYGSNGYLDIYGIPFRRQAFGENGYTVERDMDNSVIMWNSVLRSGSMFTIAEIARRVSNIQRVIDINVNAQRTPYVLKCNEKTKKSVEIAFSQISDNKPSIVMNDGLIMDGVQVLALNAPYVADKLREELNSTWNDGLSCLGIPVIIRNKAERLITGEVEGDNSAAQAQLNTRLAPRKRACQQINEKFGLNIDVEYRKPDISMVAGGGEDVHTGASQVM